MNPSSALPGGFAKSAIVAPQHSNALARQVVGQHEERPVAQDILRAMVASSELRARWPEVKVLFMSGYPNEVLLRHGLMNGEIDYLEKPFTPAELAAKVREVMG